MLRCLIIFALCIPGIIGFILLEALRTETNDDFDYESCLPDPAGYQLLEFFEQLIVYSLTTFVIFAYSDSLCLWAGLYDRAPTPNNITFNKDDDRHFLGAGTTQILGD